MIILGSIIRIGLTNLYELPPALILPAIYIYELTLCGEVRAAGTDLTAPLLLLKRLCSNWKLESSLSSSTVAIACSWWKVPAKNSNKGLKS